MALKVTDYCYTTLANACGAGDTSLVVASTATMPDLSAVDAFTFLTLFSITNDNREVVKVTSFSGNTLTVVRAQGGTSALAFGYGTRVELRLCRAVFDWIINDKEFRFFPYLGTPAEAGSFLATAQDGDLFMNLINSDLYQRNAGVWGVPIGQTSRPRTCIDFFVVSLRTYKQKTN